MSKKSTSKLTKWEAGQELIAAQDEIFERQKELREGGYPKQADLLHQVGMEIGRAFNLLESHQFGLRDFDACDCDWCVDRAQREVR